MKKRRKKFIKKQFGFIKNLLRTWLGINEIDIRVKLIEKKK